MKVRLILPVTIRKRFSLPQTIEGINFGLVRMYVTPYRISWIVFIQKKNLGGWGWWGGRQGGCEQRIKVFVKIQKKKNFFFFFFWGGGGRGGSVKGWM